MNDMQRYLVDEFVEDYKEGQISRRKALKLLAGITGLAAAQALLAACGTPAPSSSTAATSAPAAAPAAAITSAPAASEATASAPTAAAPAAAAPTAATEAAAATSAPAAAGTAANSVLADDPAVKVEMTQITASDGNIMAYIARPASGAGPFPIVLVCHENKGLTPHIEDVARRVAKAGYIGVAVDLLAREGGTAAIKDADTVPGLLSKTPPERQVQDFRDALAYVQKQSDARPDRVGMVGFCFGGGITWRVALAEPTLRAAVPFYGPPPAAADVPKINAAVLAIYAEKDQRITQSAPAIEAAMQQAGKTYEKMIYPGVDHAFHNDTGPRYSPQAAQEAWAKTLDWFNRYLNA